MSSAPEREAYATALDFTRDEVAHRVLSLCAETDHIIRLHCGGTEWVALLRRRWAAASESLAAALTVLDKSGLICWYEDRNDADTEYGDVTPLGTEVLARWDAELLGGAV